MPPEFAPARRWALLALSLIIAFGGVLAVTLMIVVQNEHERQRDMCALVSGLYSDPDSPPPTSEFGRRQLAAAQRYLERRC